MKRILLSILVISVLLLGACDELVPTATPAPAPAPASLPAPELPEEQQSPTIPEPEPEPSEVPLSYEVNAYVKQVKGTETKTLQIGEYITSETEEGWLDVARVEVKNTDTVAGTFLVIFYVDKPTFGEISLKRKLEIEPGETKIAECPADELGDWSYEVIPSTKVEE